MKAISLWQPWATLVAIGAKKIETRSWKTSYRGPLLIHAAKRQSFNFKNLWTFRLALSEAGYQTPDDLPLGALVCIVDLVDIVPTQDVILRISSQEFQFGDYTAGRWAWKLENITRLTTPKVCRGAQGIFHVDYA